MIDLFESILKTHTVVIMAEYFKHNHISDTAKGMLSAGLRTPSLGTWQLFSRELYKELNANKHPWLLPSFEKEFEALDKALNAEKTNVISFRNGYAHGATPSDEQCLADIARFEPFMELLLQSEWLKGSNLEVKEHHVYLTTPSGTLCLHPVLVHRPEGENASFAFFNDLKNDKVGLLNYPLSKHYREKDFYSEFHEMLPLQEWKKTGNNEFYQRIEELTETFKGRTLEREALLKFVLHKNKGYCSVQGNPGLGKSALIAQFFKDLRAHDELKNLQVVEYFIRRETPQAQAEYLLTYLIKRTDELFPKGREIRAEGKMVFDLQYQLFQKWRLWSEEHLGSKLLFLIDGLDEGVENNVVTYLPRENFENILIIYGSRPGGHKSIDELWSQLPSEHHTRLELSGLSKEDIRALIYEVASKYELGRENPWIDAVQQRSQGNPLYLKLLCDAIENGGIALNDIAALPKEINEYYKAILLRYAGDPDGDALLNGLFAFAAAKDYLTFPHLGLINQLGSATLMRIGSTLKEVLYENPLTEEVLDYQLFHESFREYLVKEKRKEVQDAAERIIDFCAAWQELEGSWEQRYALEHYASHLYESPKKQHGDLLLKLMYNSAYNAAQKHVLRGFDATQTLYQRALLKASETERYDEQLEAALCLVDLKYEEANDAPQIMAMVADGDIDLALKRIETFGGEDEEGVKRKFMLYMLCLMELTLLGSKDKPFRKSAIERLLDHLDEQLPKDHSILEWNDFFPSYLMFQMACNWAELDLDYLITYKRTKNWKTNWIAEKGPYNEIQLQVLHSSAQGIFDDNWKSSALNNISCELAKQGKIKEALDCAQGISDDKQKFIALKNISCELAKQDKIEQAQECAKGISDDKQMIIALKNISGKLAEQGKFEQAATVLNQALESAKGISDDWQKSSALKEISAELAKQGKFEQAATVLNQALECAKGISDDWQKSSALKEISAELAKQGKFEQAATVLNQALECAQGIFDDNWYMSNDLQDIYANLAKLEKSHDHAKRVRVQNWYRKSSALKDISVELTKQEKIDQALECAKEIIDETEKSSALKDISVELAKQGKSRESASVLQEALECAQEIIDDHKKTSTLIDIALELAIQGKSQEALDCVQKMNDESDKSSVLKDIAVLMFDQGHTEIAELMINESLSCAQRINSNLEKANSLQAIATELMMQGKINEAFDCIKFIRSDKRSFGLKALSTALARKGKIKEALECAASICEHDQKKYTLLNILFGLANHGKIEDVEIIIKESLKVGIGISDDKVKFGFLMLISSELAKKKKIQDALACARGIKSNVFEKVRTLMSISSELNKQLLFEEAITINREAFKCTRFAWTASERDQALANICIELTRLGKIEEAKGYINNITTPIYLNVALSKITSELAKQKRINEAFECLNYIDDENLRIEPLKDISIELVKQGKVNEALDCIEEIPDEASDKSAALQNISKELLIQGNTERLMLSVRKLKDEHAKCETLYKIIVELVLIGQIKKAIQTVEEISLEFWNSLALFYISTKLAKEGKIKEALICTEEINDDFEKSWALIYIARELKSTGDLKYAATLMHKSLDCARTVVDENLKCEVFIAIFKELIIEGKIMESALVLEEVICSAESINAKDQKSYSLAYIASSLAQMEGRIEEAKSLLNKSISYINENLDSAEKTEIILNISRELLDSENWIFLELTCLEIPQIADRHSFWKATAKQLLAKFEYLKALHQVKQFQIEETRLFYLKGWAESVELTHVNDECIREALPLMSEDSESIETLLQKYAAQLVTLGQPSKELTTRLNRTLNVQWLLDIVAQFPKEEAVQRLSTNLESWLHEVEDEDDRDQIALWARQVAKDKLTEEEFSKRLNDLL